MNKSGVSQDPLLQLLDAGLASSTRDAAIDALLADREAIQRMKLALAFDTATADFVRAAQALPVREPWFQRWQLWFGPVAAAAALYAVIGGLDRPSSAEWRMAEMAGAKSAQVAHLEDRISGGSFEPGAEIFRQSFD
jgi:hypothetical protein